MWLLNVVDSSPHPLILTENTITLTLWSAVIFSSRFSRFTCWWRELWRETGEYYNLKVTVSDPITVWDALSFPEYLISAHVSALLCTSFLLFAFTGHFHFHKRWSLILFLCSAHLTTDNVAVAHRREVRLCLCLSSHRGSKARVKTNTSVPIGDIKRNT